MKQRTVLLLAVMAIGGIGAFVGWLLHRRSQREAAWARAGVASRALTQCLVGGPPFPPDDASLRARLRDMELASYSETGPDARRWPLRCVPLMARVEAAAAEAQCGNLQGFGAVKVAESSLAVLASRSGAYQVRGVPNLVAPPVNGPPPWANLEAIRVSVIGRLRAAGLPLDPLDLSAPGGAPLRVLDDTQVRPLFNAPLYETGIDRVVGGDLHVAVRHGQVCEVFADASDAAAHCRVGPSVEAVGIAQGTESTPALLLGDIHSSTGGMSLYQGEERISDSALDAYALDAHDAVVLHFVTHYSQPELVGWPGPSALSSLVPTLPSLPADAEARLVADQVVWTSGRHAYVQALGGETKPTDLGAFVLPLRVPGCKDAPLTAFRFLDGTLAWHTAGLDWRTDTAWRAVPFDASLTCYAESGSVVATWVDRDAGNLRRPVVHRFTSSPHGSPSDTHAIAGPFDVPLPEECAAGELGGQTLFVYRAAWDRDFGLRARLAPIDQLGAAPEMVLFDTAGLRGVGLRIESRAPRAYVLFTHRDSTYALLVDAVGRVAPVQPATVP